MLPDGYTVEYNATLGTWIVEGPHIAADAPTEAEGIKLANDHANGLWP
jgi:hypothetical protein